MSAKIMPYGDFDSQRDAPLTCPSCGWSGSAEDNKESTTTCSMAAARNATG
jgi:hypothetical protein